MKNRISPVLLTLALTQGCIVNTGTLASINASNNRAQVNAKADVRGEVKSQASTAVDASPDGAGKVGTPSPQKPPYALVADGAHFLPEEVEIMKAMGLIVGEGERNILLGAVNAMERIQLRSRSHTRAEFQKLLADASARMDVFRYCPDGTFRPSPAPRIDGGTPPVLACPGEAKPPTVPTPVSPGPLPPLPSGSPSPGPVLATPAAPTATFRATGLTCVVGAEKAGEAPSTRFTVTFSDAVAAPDGVLEPTLRALEHYVFTAGLTKDYLASVSVFSNGKPVPAHSRGIGVGATAGSPFFITSTPEGPVEISLAPGSTDKVVIKLANGAFFDKENARCVALLVVGGRSASGMPIDGGASQPRERILYADVTYAAGAGN